ncbi:LysR family transcriptional regulator [Cellulomonas sp. IC4_254]|uniref:LysR substrate-binding domain-containing protein n=1 Tax=Cellulomonas sp. IC4_254 TaxID=2714040 RepID=UPI00196B3209
MSDVSPRTGGPGSAADAALATAALDLNLLRTFLAVYRAGSLTAAAQSLGIAQPTVTAQVRTLESQVGEPLFGRRPRGVEPTARAHELAGHVAAPLDALASLGSRDAALAGHEPPVRLGGPAELLSTRVLPALAPLVSQGVRLVIAPGLANDLVEDLRAGRHDLVIATHRPPGRAFVTQPLAHEDYVLVAAPAWHRVIAHLLPDDPCVAVRDVPLVAYAPELPIIRRYWRTAFGKRSTARAAVTVPDLRGVVSAVTAGAGYSVLPRYLCQVELDAGDLVLLHDVDPAPGNTVHLVQRTGVAAPHVERVAARLLEVGPGW